jgi:hypothetical protein
MWNHRTLKKINILPRHRNILPVMLEIYFTIRFALCDAYVNKTRTGLLIDNSKAM